MGSALLSTVVTSTSIVVICLLFSVALLVAWWQFDMQRHAAAWALSFLAASIGHGLRISTMLFPNDAAPLSMLAFHASVASFALLALGFRQRAERSLRAVWVAWLVATLVLSVSWSVRDDEWRTWSRITTSCADFVMLSIMVVTLRRARGAGAFARWALGAYALYMLTVGLAAWLARAGGPWSDRMFVVVMSVGTPAGMIGTGVLTMLIVAADLARTLRNQARTDPLTGLYNRRAIDEEAEALLSREFAGQQQHAVSIVIADLDHFKSINDRFGHAVGDKVLRRFSTHLRKHLGTADLAGRMGGEEFVFLMPGLTASEAVQRVERIRQGVPAAIGSIVGNERVTASFGMARVRIHEPFADALARADEALYAAKAAGRNRLVSEVSSASALSSA
ncbi:GGDEF domain-containing protein [Robbsia andropogonis]|uniref:GGDEF domain-containing protein n=1 Tax=Robbsia andropogonis TaxID=28092 RepID=UPI000B2816D7|nr:GGDEF domain-containing protein [Robbsia andropogonis]